MLYIFYLVRWWSVLCTLYLNGTQGYKHSIGICWWLFYLDALVGVCYTIFGCVSVACYTLSICVVENMLHTFYPDALVHLLSMLVQCATHIPFKHVVKCVTHHLFEHVVKCVTHHLSEHVVKCVTHHLSEHVVKCVTHHLFEHVVKCVSHRLSGWIGYTPSIWMRWRSVGWACSR